MQARYQAAMDKKMRDDFLNAGINQPNTGVVQPIIVGNQQRMGVYQPVTVANQPGTGMNQPVTENNQQMTGMNLQISGIHRAQRGERS